MKVHLFSGSGFAWRVLLACAIKNVDFTEEFLRPTQDDLKSPGFLKLNPRGKVPVMEDGPFVLRESMAIIAYLDKRYPSPPLFGANPEETGLIWQAVLDLDLYMSAHWVSDIIAPIATGTAGDAAAQIQDAAAHAHTEIARLDRQLGDADWFVGKVVSAADIALYPMLEALIRFATKPQEAPLALGFETFGSRYPALQSWRHSMRELPRYERTYPDFWRELDAGQA